MMTVEFITALFYWVYPDLWSTRSPRKGGPSAGWWTMHRSTVLPACVPGYHQCDCGRVAAPRFILV